MKVSKRIIFRKSSKGGGGQRPLWNFSVNSSAPSLSAKIQFYFFIATWAGLSFSLSSLVPGFGLPSRRRPVFYPNWIKEGSITLRAQNLCFGCRAMILGQLDTMRAGRTIWHLGLFDTADNLRPSCKIGQFDTKKVGRTIWHRGQFDTMKVRGTNSHCEKFSPTVLKKK